MESVFADTVGSLLRPAYLREARAGAQSGAVGEDELRSIEDRAALGAIALQESVGLDVITDGEMRRAGWATTPSMTGFTRLPSERWPSTVQPANLRRHRPNGTVERLDLPVVVVTKRIRARYSLAEREYRFLREHARARTKFCLAAPSWHRAMWHPELSRDAYPRIEDFLDDLRDSTRGVVQEVAALGCDYVQLDAPHYSFYLDPGLRARIAASGRDPEREAIADAELDSSVFDGIAGVTRAMHICRGNGAGTWLASGGYAAIAAEVFPRLRLDRLLLEYDSARSGDFAPLRHVGKDTVVVLGLITTKSGDLEDAGEIEARIREAAQLVPLERLALSPQCGFASVEAGNPLMAAQQKAKLRTVAEVARRVWGPP
jgi:5-methyltetrahydropteroyltriglutamate--homocysteine methyltransferase